MKKFKIFLIILFDILLLSNIVLFCIKAEKKNDKNEPILNSERGPIIMKDTRTEIGYPELLTVPEIFNELNTVAKEYGLNFENLTEIQTNYDIRTIKDPYPNYDTYEPVFYNIPVNGYEVYFGHVDKKHKIAILYKDYKKEFYSDKESAEDAIRTRYESHANTFFKQLIEQADSSMEVTEAFQNEDKYTAIYVEIGFLERIYYDNGKEGALKPYLEKAFESLGYTKKEETK